MTQVVDGSKPGCGMLMCGMWTCTDHIVSPGSELLHIGGSYDCICGVRGDSGWEMELAVAHNRSKTWPDVVKMLEAEGRWFVPPTDEEMEAAAQAALRMVKEMADGS